MDAKTAVQELNARVEDRRGLLLFPLRDRFPPG
jgi:hypothetical protein